ncbi:hypothetical protein FisN_4Hh064 [Fistulifera solaris]|uniref:SET domain-containing protein n=1 Tax=Fistulifera solaris TaxID=1519565 RepID=A0A1Z5KEJ4_FISSO|nr:hypothetical protein FisN_4Hh064 [Fistulifera solaris]|eukprot:GAX24545.1 hypothetical protein FisN_4Hh064 [Fistulifera solaris]
MRSSIIYLLLTQSFLAASGSDETCVILETGETQCHANAPGDEKHDETESVSTQQAPVCSLYIAESTIPGAGLGMFTGVARKAKEVIWPGDVVNPVVDRKYHQMVLGPETYKSEDVSLNPLEDYEWLGGAMGIQHETAHPYVWPRFIHAFAPGFTSVLNSHPALFNCDLKSIPKYDINGLHRSKDPGVGAFTPYFGGNHIALEDIQTGAELFLYYGDPYFRLRTKIYGLLPLPIHHDYADIYVKKYYSAISALMYLGIWNYLVDNFPYYRRLMNAMPKTKEDLELVVNGSIRDMHRPAATRSLQKLGEEGRCVDTLEVRPSTIPQAGRGAFATRFLPKGIVVTGTPLIFVPTDDFFKMYEGDWETKKEVPIKEKVVHYQISYNYCLHHPDSSIFLCPYGIGVNYINHGGKDGANVKLQWASEGELGHNNTILQQSPRHLLGNAAPRIFLNYVATQDIQEGEEILLDYGDAWQAAWDHHVRTFEEHRVEGSTDYQSARDWTKKNLDTMLRTEEEQVENPYPFHFALQCIIDYDLDRRSLLSLWGREHTPSIPCRIKKRRKAISGNYEYKVLYKAIGTAGHQISKQLIEDIEDMKWTESDWLPQAALRFIDRPYSTDLLLPHAFRHPIGLPDDLFPDAWRNVHLSFADFASSQ